MILSEAMQRTESGARRPMRFHSVAALLLLALLTTGCAGNNDSSQAQTEPAPEGIVRSEVERGPVKFTVEIAPDKPRLSDAPRLTLTIQARRGVRIDKPPFGEALGDFLIRDFHEPAPEVDRDTDILRQVYTLEPTRAGKLTVDPIALRFHDQRQDGDGKEHTIESEALTVEVSTVLGDEMPTLAELRPAAGPIELPASGGLGWPWSLAILTVLVGSGVVLWKIRKKRTVGETPLSPQELAWLELEQIVKRKLAETDVKAFYVGLTGVVRRYIERSTGVHAPEQTTEEFLREIVDGSVFAADDQQRLQNFLESADLVKFAAFEPEAADIEASFARAQDFIRLRCSEPREVAA